MKKNLFILFIISLFFVSCNNSYFTGIYSYEISNESSKTVTVSCSDGYTVSLAPGEKDIHDTDHNNTFSVDETQRISITSNFKGRDKKNPVTVKDIKCYEWRAYNSNDETVILGEINGNLGDNFGDVVIIPAKTIVDIKLYTSSPNFYVLYTNGFVAPTFSVSFTIK